MLSSCLVDLDGFDGTFALDGLATEAGPADGAEPGEEWPVVALVIALIVTLIFDRACPGTVCNPAITGGAGSGCSGE